MPFAKVGRGNRVLVEPLDAIRWALREDVRYLGERDEFIVPGSESDADAYVTDFASVPRVAVWLIARVGAWTKPAILHDFLLTHCLVSGRISSVDADNLFRRALREEGVPKYRRNLMWTGVRWAAAFSKTRRPGWWSTFPEMMKYTIIFLCSIVPPIAMIFVAIALVVHGAIEWIAGKLSGEKASVGSLST